MRRIHNFSRFVIYNFWLYIIKHQKTIDKLISKEMYHFNEIKHDCQDVINNIWDITTCIEQQNEITISYYKMNREYVERRVRPIATTFTDYYFI